MTGLLKRWTDQEWIQAKELLKTKSVRDVGSVLGRPYASVKEKMRWEEMTPSDREARNARTREERRAARLKPRAADFVPIKSARASEEIIAERDARMAIPHRDLTAAFFNDPRPGYSALERRS